MVPPGGESPAAYRTPPADVPGDKDGEQNNTSDKPKPQVAEEKKANEEKVRHAEDDPDSVPAYYVNFPFPPFCGLYNTQINFK